MGTEKAQKDLRRAVRRATSESVALNVLELHRFLRRRFLGRMKWIFFGR